MVGTDDEADGVGVEFAIRDGAEVNELAEANAGEGGDGAGEQLEAHGVVVRGLGEGDAIFRGARDDDAKIVGLGAGVALADFGPAAVHAGQGEAGDIEGGDFCGGAVDIVERALGAADGGGVEGHLLDGARAQGRGLEAGERLAVDFAAFAADDVADTGAGEEVAFVGGIDEDLRLVTGAVAGQEGFDAVAVAGDGFEAALGDHAHFGFREQSFEGGHVHLRLSVPQGRAGLAGGGAGEEFAGDAADDFFIADIGAGESAGDHAAEPFGGFEDDDGGAFARGGERGAQAARRGAVDEHVARLRRLDTPGAEQKGEDRGEGRNAHPRRLKKAGAAVSIFRDRSYGFAPAPNNVRNRAADCGNSVPSFCPVPGIPGESSW